MAIKPWYSIERSRTCVPRNLTPIAGLAVVVAAMLVPLRAADLQSWNEVNFQFWHAGRYSLRARGVLRARNHLSDLYERWGGGEFRFAATRRVTLVFGYMARDSEYAKGNYDLSHRITTGASYRALSWRSGAISGTTYYERDWSVFGKRDVNRLRQSVEYEVPRWRVSPWLFEEMAFQSRQGLARNRVRLGLVWRFYKRKNSLVVAYQNQQLEGALGWVGSHAIYMRLNVAR